MALRIGKKKSKGAAASPAADTSAPIPAAAPAPADTDDWSDFGNIPNDTSSPSASSDDWTSFDDLVDPSNDDPANSPAVASAVPDTASGKAPKVRKAKTPRTGQGTSKGKGLPKAALIAIPVLLVGAAGAAYMMKQASPPVDELSAGEDGIVRSAPVRKKPATPPAKVAAAPKKASGAKPTGTKPSAAPAAAKPGAPKVAVTKPATAKPGTPVVKPVASKPGTPKPVVGVVNLTPTTGLGVPGFEATGTPKPVVGVVNLTRVSPSPNRLVDERANAAAMVIPVPPKSANPGISIQPHHVALAPALGGGGKAASTVGLTPAQISKRSGLKALWNEGAAAKRRGDTKKAKEIWTRGLKQAEASPRMDASAAGFRGSLAKLR